MLSRIFSAVGEQQYTIDSMGWTKDNNGIEYSRAGARRHQYEEIETIYDKIKAYLERIEKC